MRSRSGCAPKSYRLFAALKRTYQTGLLNEFLSSAIVSSPGYEASAVLATDANSHSPPRVEAARRMSGSRAGS